MKAIISVIFRNKHAAAKIKRESIVSTPTLRKEAVGAERQYDIVIFGATGFTGRLAALYVARQYGARSFKWALAGRRRDACNVYIV